MRKGWYDTGDIVSIDSDEFITILGRAKRFAKIAGEMISLTTIEENVWKMYQDHQSAALSLPDEKKGEVILLFTTNSHATREAIHKQFKSIGLSELFVPKIIKIVKELPILATGKVNYVALKEYAIAQLAAEIEDIPEDE